ncbi:MAG: efflux transporter periplasmic adaptor subunit [Sphingobacteriales bacterium 50-39]|nr:efflux RND transporter periplasmic adaptor subunit [Sphingobacteriales bacterium]OJW61114.1 MAG: efflux transporter periplasmic adaptor subunit [Sphingobacteriales bacterium 50-39]
MKKNILLGWLLLLLAGLSQTGCSSYGGQNSKQDTLQLPVITLAGKDTVLQTAYVADIQAIKNVEIRARVKGFLEGIYIDEGRLVKKGQLLFKINDDEYKTALSKAHAALQNAEAAARATQLEVERVQLLVDRHVVVPSELEVAKARLAADKANIEEARSSVTSAENHLSYTAVRAPFDGLIDRIPLKPGSLIDEGTLLTSLSDISAMYAYFSFPENEYLQYQRTRHLTGQGHDSTGQPSHGIPNDKVKLVLADGSSYPYTGIIETVEGEIEQTTGSIDFRARFPNPQLLLRHGATARLYISTRADSVLLVPQRSVFDIQDKSYVYLVDKDNKLHMQSFEPLTRFSHYYIVKQGLHPSDRILYEGAQNVREGMVIKPRTTNINL